MARKILLADDSVTAQNMGRKILTDAGYEVITVNNGSAALKKISETKPDLIVLDVYMPGYSGLEVCQRLKEAQETARIPVLLTVGKLEPFKPEEAKRVRADAYIVKPFEASELLSALTKLEDKVVPRAESSKPGRFARSIAAIEEGRYDSTVANDEDSGWKNRIAFPTAHKDKAAETDDAVDPAIYNAMNKDLRTVVDHSPEPSSPEVKAPEAHVDLAALAPPGLPTDVTPEEIAALAAAAAQVKSSVAARAAEAHPTPAPAAVETIRGVAEISEAPQIPEREKVDQFPARAEEDSKEEQARVAAQSSQDVSPDPRGDEPVTMAAAAGADAGSASHWTAVAVALTPEEAGISLEAEMQQAHVAFAAAQAADSERAPAPVENVSSSAESTIPHEAGIAEPVTPAVQEAMPEVVQTLGEIAGVALDAMNATAHQLQTTAEVQSEPAHQVEAQQGPVASAEATTPAYISETQTEAPAGVAELKPEEPVPAIVASEMIAAEESGLPNEIRGGISSTAENTYRPESENGSASAPPQVDGAAESIEPAESQPNPALVPAAAVHNEPLRHEGGDMAKKESDIAATTAAAWASWRRIRESGGTHTPSAQADEQSPSAPEESSAMAVAAGAEHRPEEQRPEDASEPESEEIASIVDSVLADLRPKIVEEISRKLGKKK